MPQKVTTVRPVDKFIATALVAGAVNAVLRQLGSRLLGEQSDGAVSVRGVEKMGRRLKGARVMGRGRVTTGMAESR